jgi:pyruvate/2-oxoglutarate dehydrogenase complex dihydrolipoamide dehydrogenase (E3) component
MAGKSGPASRALPYETLSSGRVSPLSTRKGKRNEHEVRRDRDRRGTGRSSLAARLTAAGQTLAVIERHLVGGTCVNTGCKPTKTLVASAYAAHIAQRGADYGVMTGDVRIDMARVHARSQKISADARAGNQAWLGNLGLELAGVETDARGYIRVNERLESTSEGIWALGDCNGRGAFTHTAYNDFEIVAANLLDGGKRRVDDRVPCYALYLDRRSAGSA